MRTWGDCYGYLLLATGRADVMIDDVDSGTPPRFIRSSPKPVAPSPTGVETSPRSAATSSPPTSCSPSRCATFSSRAHEASDLDFSKGDGLITVVTQDSRTGAVLMVAHMDREAFDRTVETGEMHYRSRTRGLWHKGATSGNTQQVVSLVADCDADAILARVIPAGPACHTGSVTCFSTGANGDAFTELADVIEARSIMASGDERNNRQLYAAPAERPQSPHQEAWRGDSRARPRTR